jgi:phospholipid/cholesterol/gamma-HCH transport system substrate-binding protein
MRRRDEVLVGLFTLAAAAVLIVGTLWLIRGGLSRGYPLYTRFAWGAGLKQGQPVLFSGVDIGYVDKVELLKNGGLVTTLRIYRKQQVPIGTVATIRPNGIFGDVLVALQAEKPTDQMHAPGDTIPSGPEGTQLSDVVTRIDSVGQALLKLTRSMQKELVDDHSIADLRRAVNAARSMFGSLERVVQQQSAELTTTQESLRRMASAVDSAQIDSTMRAIRTAATATSVMMDSLRTTTDRLDGLIAKIESGNGSAARFLNDPGLYDDARRTVQRLDSLVSDIKANPKRYLSFRFSIW